MNTVLGIDPGAHGAVAQLLIGGDQARLTWVSTLADLTALKGVMASARLTVVEAQHASPQMGVRSAFALGAGYGMVRGMAMAVSPHWIAVEPVVWRGAFGLRNKDDGIAMARRVIDEPERALRHDEADAILLAWWGWRTVLAA